MHQHIVNNSMVALHEVFSQGIISWELWPLQLPNLNPCDFYLWAILKGKVYVNNPHSLEQLQENIWREIFYINVQKRWPWIISCQGGPMQDACHISCGNQPNDKLYTRYLMSYGRKSQCPLFWYVTLLKNRFWDVLVIVLQIVFSCVSTTYVDGIHLAQDREWGMGCGKNSNGPSGYINFLATITFSRRTLFHWVSYGMH
jgi:hypothetical protein